MCPNFKRISRKTFLFSLSPLALSLALALNPYSIEAQANTYEYNGKWVADDIDPTNPPFCKVPLSLRIPPEQLSLRKTSLIQNLSQVSYCLLMVLGKDKTGLFSG